MPLLVLTDAHQRALRALLAAEPLPGAPTPSPATLTLLQRFVGCDHQSVDMVAGHVGERWGLDVVRRLDRGEPGLPPGADGAALSFRPGPEQVLRIQWVRRHAPFSDEDLARIRLIVPVLPRLFRRQPPSHLPETLTVRERRVLAELAAGWSNEQIAALLSIAPSTVRKHLENAYRKLGVHSRVAAVVALEMPSVPAAPEPRQPEPVRA